MPTRNTMVVPCMVNIWLKPCGVNISFSGFISCKRISVASIPPNIKKINPAPIYIMPSFLWSTEITQLCTRLPKPMLVSLIGWIGAVVMCGSA